MWSVTLLIDTFDLDYTVLVLVVPVSCLIIKLAANLYISKGILPFLYIYLILPLLYIPKRILSLLFLPSLLAVNNLLHLLNLPCYYIMMTFLILVIIIVVVLLDLRQVLLNYFYGTFISLFI